MANAIQMCCAILFLTVWLTEAYSGKKIKRHYEHNEEKSDFQVTNNSVNEDHASINKNNRHSRSISDEYETSVESSTDYNERSYMTKEDTWVDLVINGAKLVDPYLPEEIRKLNLNWRQVEVAMRSLEHFTTTYEVGARSLNMSPIMSTVRAVAAAAEPLIMDFVRTGLGMMLDAIDNTAFMTTGHAISRRGLADSVLDDIMDAFTAIMEHMSEDVQPYDSCCLVSGQDGTVDYSGWRVVRSTVPKSANTSDIFDAIEDNTDVRLLNTFMQDGALVLDVMLRGDISLMDIIWPSLLRSDLAALMYRGLPDPLQEEQLIEDLGNHITKYVRSAEGKLSWDKYYRGTSIQQFTEDLASNNDNVELLRIGTTREGRLIQALVIADKPKEEVEWYKLRNRSSKKPIIMLEFGLHAREWISPAAGTYVASELSKMGPSFLKHATWVIIPLANPDGYEYSHTNDRMWRKNRRPNWSNRKCPGVDLNRNFDIEWATTGSSSNPCSEIYHGTSPMSEPESIAIKKLITRFNNVQVYMSIHSYSQVFLYPYAYTTDPAPNERELKNFATAFSRHIRRKGGRSYGVEQAGVGYQSGGGSDDYAYNQNIPFAYTLELPDKGYYGFLMPETEIYSISREIWAGFKCQLGELVPEAKDFC